jgi:hypothetical protein
MVPELRTTYSLCCSNFLHNVKTTWPLNGIINKFYSTRTRSHNHLRTAQVFALCHITRCSAGWSGLSVMRPCGLFCWFLPQTSMKFLLGNLQVHLLMVELFVMQSVFSQKAFKWDGELDSKHNWFYPNLFSAWTESLNLLPPSKYIIGI